MNDIDDKVDVVAKIMKDLAHDSLTARSKLPDYGRTWSPWREWDGLSDMGPDDVGERLVNVYRRSPLSDHYLVDEAHHIEWKHSGGRHDVLAFRVELLNEV